MDALGFDLQELERQEYFCVKDSNAIRNLPAGQIGSLKFYKSGKTTMRVGDIDLVVTEATPFPFSQEILCVDAQEKNCVNLGAIEKRVMCTPDIATLLAE